MRRKTSPRRLRVERVGCPDAARRWHAAYALLAEAARAKSASCKGLPATPAADTGSSAFERAASSGGSRSGHCDGHVFSRGWGGRQWLHNG